LGPFSAEFCVFSAKNPSAAPQSTGFGGISAEIGVFEPKTAENGGFWTVLGAKTPENEGISAFSDGLGGEISVFGGISSLKRLFFIWFLVVFFVLFFFFEDC
jgi:hypothetical protein